MKRLSLRGLTPAVLAIVSIAFIIASCAPPPSGGGGGTTHDEHDQHHVAHHGSRLHPGFGRHADPR